MGVLRKAYVKVAPDTSGFDKELKERLSKVNADAAGDKVGKTFTTSLTRRVDRELKAFNLPTLDLKANPRDVVKAVETSLREVERLRDSADSIELRLKANKTLGDLTRFKKTIGDIGPESAEGFMAKFQGRLGPMMASMPISGPMAAGLGIAAAAAAPTLAATVSAAVVGGAGIGGVIGGVTLAARDPRVKKAGGDLGAFMLGDLTSRADGFVDPVLAGIAKIHAGFTDMGPDLDRIFKSSRFIDPLVDGAVSGGKRFVRGFADAIDQADPVMQALGDAIDRIGEAGGDALSLLAQDADEGASALNDLVGGVTKFIQVSTGMVHGLAQVKGYMDRVDTGIDRARYQLEAWGQAVDLTADGFKSGSVQAEAYERATLGTATAADVGTLRLTGMSDAQIRALDSSHKLDDVMKAMEPDVMKAARAIAVQTDANLLLMRAQGQLDAAMGGTTQKLDFQRFAADELTKAQDRLFGASIKQTEANEAYQASWDKLSGSVSSNSGSLNINTEKGRANRDALEALLGANNDLFTSNVAAGVSIDSARVKHEARTEAVRKEAIRLGLNKTETDKLIATYGRIPPAKTTKLSIDPAGLKGVQDTLTDLYIAQQALARGITFKQAEGSFRNQLQGFFSAGRLATGGKVPGWSPTATADNVPIWATADEWMIRQQSARKMERENPGALDYINRHGDLPFENARRYAGGGPVWSRDVDMPVTAAKTRLMSKADALSRVTPAAPGGGPTDQFMIRVLRQAFPGLSMISGYRPGSRTLTGNVSYHASHRAVDYPASRPMAQWVNNNYMARTKELITPWNDLNIWNGKRHTYTGAVWNQHNFAGGNAHDHWAMDQGGYLMPGLNPPIYNGTGRAEPVTPGADIDALRADVRALGTDLRAIVAVLQKAPGETGAVIARQMGSALGGVTRDAARLSRNR